MSRRLFFALACLAAAAAAAGPPAWAQTPFSADIVPRRTGLARAGLERQWMAIVPMHGNERVLTISLSNDMFFAHTNAGNFHAFDSESGRHLWTANLGTSTAVARPASVNSKYVFVTSANHLFALDRRVGRRVWTKDLSTLPTSATAADERLVMVGLATGKIMAYEAASGRFAWNWQTTGAMTSRPQPAVTFVAFGAKDGKLYVAQSEGEGGERPALLYRIPTGGEIGAGLGTYGDRLLLVPSADHNLYGVDLFSADVRWVYSSGAPIHQEPLVADNDCYVVNSKGTFAAVDVTSGEPRWVTSTQGGRLIAVSGTRVYFQSPDNDLFIVDRQSGKMLADPATTFHRNGLNLRNYSLSWTNRDNDRLYFGTPSGMIIALHEIGQLAPRPLRDPKLPPFGTIPAAGVDIDTKPPAEAAPPAEGTAPAEGEKPPAGDQEPAEPKADDKSAVQ